MEEVSVNGSSNRVTSAQREMMLHFMRSHPALATGRCSAPDEAKHKAQLLLEMAQELNSIGNGCTKTPEKWYKCWQDWKSDVKKKASKLKRHAGGTGGGPPCKIQLTQLEEDLIRIMGPIAVTGQAVVDPLDAQLAQAAEVHNIPEETWMEAVVVPADVPAEDVEPPAVTQQTPAPLVVPVPLSSTGSSVDKQSTSVPCSSESGSSNNERRIRRASHRFRNNSETQLVREDIVRAATESAEARAKQVFLQERGLELQEISIRLQKEGLELKKRDLDIATMNSEAALKNSTATESVAASVAIAVQVYLCTYPTNHPEAHIIV